MTENIATLIPQMRPAFEMFFEELQLSLKLFQELLSQADRAPTKEKGCQLITAQSKQLAERLHLLKGGSGFLKLNSLHHSTSEAEKFFLDLSSKDSAGTDSTARLKSVVEDLKSERKSLSAALGECRES